MTSMFDQYGNETMLLSEMFRNNWSKKQRSFAETDDSLTNLSWLCDMHPVGLDLDSPRSHCTTIDKRTVSHDSNASSSTLYAGSLFDPKIRAEYRTRWTGKPPFSYATLICLAMRELGKPKVTLSDIYSWIVDNFAYYRHTDTSWQNSVRHNLSLNKCFEKVPRDKTERGKGGFWRVNPNHADWLEANLAKCRRAAPPPPPLPSAALPPHAAAHSYVMLVNQESNRPAHVGGGTNMTGNNSSIQVRRRKSPLNCFAPTTSSSTYQSTGTELQYGGWEGLDVVGQEQHRSIKMDPSMTTAPAIGNSAFTRVGSLSADSRAVRPRRIIPQRHCYSRWSHPRIIQPKSTSTNSPQQARKLFDQSHHHKQTLSAPQQPSASSPSRSRFLSPTRASTSDATVLKPEASSSPVNSHHATDQSSFVSHHVTDHAISYSSRSSSSGCSSFRDLDIVASSSLDSSTLDDDTINNTHPSDYWPPSDFLSPNGDAMFGCHSNDTDGADQLLAGFNDFCSDSLVDPSWLFVDSEDPLASLWSSSASAELDVHLPELGSMLPCTQLRDDELLTPPPVA